MKKRKNELGNKLLMLLWLFCIFFVPVIISYLTYLKFGEGPALAVYPFILIFTLLAGAILSM